MLWQLVRWLYSCTYNDSNVTRYGQLMLILLAIIVSFTLDVICSFISLSFLFPLPFYSLFSPLRQQNGPKVIMSTTLMTSSACSGSEVYALWFSDGRYRLNKFVYNSCHSKNLTKDMKEWMLWAYFSMYLLL